MMAIGAPAPVLWSSSAKMNEAVVVTEGLSPGFTSACHMILRHAGAGDAGLLVCAAALLAAGGPRAGPPV